MLSSSTRSWRQSLLALRRIIKQLSSQSKLPWFAKCLSIITPKYPGEGSLSVGLDGGDVAALLSSSTARTHLDWGSNVGHVVPILAAYAKR